MEAITTKEKLKSLTGRSVLCFWAEWSMPSKATSNILIQLEKTYKNISYFSVEAEESGEISDSFQVVAVPTVLFLIGDKEVNRLVGANPPELNRLVTEFSKSYNEVDTATTTQSVQKPNLDERLKELINQHKVMGFIKGLF
jgi:thioredoxin-like negative regulator of GroEL